MSPIGQNPAPKSCKKKTTKKKTTKKKLEKYLENTAAKHPNGEILKGAVLQSIKDKVVTYCGQDIKDANMAINMKAAPYKGAKHNAEFVDPYKEFEKALAKGKKHGMHLRKGDRDPFFKELDQLASFDPLKGKN